MVNGVTFVFEDYSSTKVLIAHECTSAVAIQLLNLLVRG